jgi:hypothetical protein
MVGGKSMLENVIGSYSRRSFWVILGVISLGLVLRLIGLTKGIWLDEFYSIGRISQGDFLANMRGQDHPPLYFIFLKVWYLVNTSEPFLRLFSVIWGVGTIIVVIKWIAGYSPRAGIISGLCCAVMPALLRFSQEIRGYSLLLFATALAFYFASQIAKNPNKRSYYIGLTAGLTAAVATHLVGVMLLPTIFLFLLLSMTSRQKHHLLPIILCLVIPGVVFLGEYYFFMPAGVRARTPETWWMPPVTGDLVGEVGSYLVGLSSIDWSFSVFEKFSVAAAFSATALLCLMFGIVAGSILAGSWRRSYPLLIAALCYCLLVIGYSIFKVPIFGERPLLPALIPLIGFLGVQVATIKIPKIQMVSIGALLVISMNITFTWIIDKAWIPVEPTREMAKTLQSLKHPHDTVMFFPFYFAGPMRYYYPELPVEDEIGINIWAIPEETERIKKIFQETSPSTVFLVARCDPETENYTYIRTLLISEIGLEDLVQRSNNLTITRYRKTKQYSSVHKNAKIGQ